jgi:hypothetical protein
MRLLMLIDPSENLSRFILQKNSYRSDNTVRYSAFIPTNAGKTSVFRTSDILEEEIWNIGVRVLDKPILGRADIDVACVIAAELCVVPSPPERHADIMGWPDERSERKMKAVLLADNARFIKNPWLPAYSFG